MAITLLCDMSHQTVVKSEILAGAMLLASVVDFVNQNERNIAPHLEGKPNRWTISCCAYTADATNSTVWKDRALRLTQLPVNYLCAKAARAARLSTYHG